jgi:hypothetical protein
MATECPDCDVPLMSDSTAKPTLTPAQLKSLANQVLGSWKFWAGVTMLVGLAAWGVIATAERFIDLRAKSYLNTLEQQATNHIGVVAGQISNQIVREFQQPRIRAAMEQVAEDRANELFTNSVWPSLQAFRQNLDAVGAQFAQSTNNIAALDREIAAARRKIATIPPSAAAAAPNPAETTPKLTLVDQQVSRNGANYILSLFFKATGSQPVGTVQLIAGTYRQTAKILNFGSVTPGQTAPAVMNDVGDASKLTFTPPQSNTPIVVALEVNGPTIVRVSGDVLEGDLTVPIAADNLPAAAAK